MAEKAEKFWNEGEGEEARNKKEEKELRNGVSGSPDWGLENKAEIPRKNITTIEKPPTKISLDGEKVRNGVAQLILTVVELLRELMEKQALRRIELGSLTEEQIEKVGATFMILKKEIEKLKVYFKLEDEDLNLELGPLLARGEEAETGKASVVEILDRLLRKGVVVKGDVVISVADVDLISLNLGLLLASIDKARELYGGAEARTVQLEEEVRKLREENVRLKQSQ